MRAYALAVFLYTPRALRALKEGYHTDMRRNLSYGIGILCMLAALYVSQRGDVAFIPPAQEVDAATVALNGYAWSENIGWISMNCATGSSAGGSVCGTPNYAVTITTNATGAPMPLSGYAWSENIGWIRFGGVGTGTGNLGAPPASTYTNPEIRGNSLVGWARACTVFASGCTGALKPATQLGGWDGWISFSSTNGGGGSAYGVTVGYGTLSSFAWGSDVVGWVDFSGVSFTSPCAPDAAYQCTVDLSGVEAQDQWCQITTSTCSYGTACELDASNNPSCVTLAPMGGLTPSGMRVRNGTPVTFTWSVDNIDTCQIRGTNGDILAFSSTTAATSLVSSNIVNETTFELWCRDLLQGPEVLLDTDRISTLPTLEQF